MLPIVADISQQHPYIDPKFTIGDRVKLKGTDLPMMVSAIYRNGTQTRIKTQWADELGDGFMDVDFAMVESVFVPSKVYTVGHFVCKCKEQDPAKIKFNGLIEHCEVCNYKTTVQSMMVLENNPGLRISMEEFDKRNKEYEEALEEQKPTGETECK